MANLNKQKQAFRDCRGPYKWRDFETLLRGLGYEPSKAGKTSGAGRKYYNATTKHLIMAHEPHDGEMGRDMVRRLQKDLTEAGLI